MDYPCGKFGGCRLVSAVLVFIVQTNRQTHTHIHTHTHRERERERERQNHRRG